MQVASQGDINRLEAQRLDIRRLVRQGNKRCSDRMMCAVCKYRVEVTSIDLKHTDWTYVGWWDGRTNDAVTERLLDGRKRTRRLFMLKKKQCWFG